MKKILLTLFAITALFFIVKKKDMTFRQSVLKAVYPVVMTMGKWFGSKTTIAVNAQNIPPPQSFYDLRFTANSQKEVAMSAYKGKKVLLVNTASDCGYSGQFSELQQLQNEFKDQLVIIGFPANDFKEQERGNDREILQFCKLNYGVDFYLPKNRLW